MQTMHYHPSVAKCRVWLLDEVHQATKDFQNSILKALEDSPKYAYFILCTTEPEKLLKTIRNRCSTFEVESLEDDEIKKLLDWVLNEEKFDIPNNVKEEITDAVDGCPRQALVILDQIIDLPENEMLDAVKDTKVDEKEVRELCQAMLKGKNWKTIARILKGLKSSEPEKIRRAVIGYMSAVLLNGGDAKAALIIDIFQSPVFNSGMSGIVLYTYQTMD
jgi:DNA polymerase III gamma/tau subunit